MEEVSRGCASAGVIMSVNNSLYCAPVMSYGSEQQRQQWLKPFASGSKLGCFALTEPGNGSDAGAASTTAVPDGSGGWILNGTKVHCTRAQGAAILLCRCWFEGFVRACRSAQNFCAMCRGFVLFAEALCYLTRASVGSRMGTRRMLRLCSPPRTNRPSTRAYPPSSSPNQLPASALARKRTRWASGAAAHAIWCLRTVACQATRCWADQASVKHFLEPIPLHDTKRHFSNHLARGCVAAPPPRRCALTLRPGFKIAMSTLDGGRIGIAAQALGIAQAALEAATNYSMQRTTFGKPIASHQVMWHAVMHRTSHISHTSPQAIQFKLADMALRIESARLLTHRAAALKDDKQP